MGRKRKGKRRVAEAQPPELKGIALLLTELPAEVVDLHGMTGRQAESRVRHFLERHRIVSAGRVVHLITGKGTRSEGPAVLYGLVRDLLDSEWGDSVAEIAGLHGGGGFAVRIAE